MTYGGGGGIHVGLCIIMRCPCSGKTVKKRTFKIGDRKLSP